MALLEVENLRVEIVTAAGVLVAVDGVGFELDGARSLGIVGESGSGKSQLALAIMGLLPPSARASGSVRFEGQELLDLGERDLARLRGARLAMVFQDAQSALNPFLTVGRQIGEVLTVHEGARGDSLRRRTHELLERVHIPDARARLDAYPHELSGGMRQRVMIAMALACKPALIIADEPTTALDVTVQAQILALIAELQAELGTALLLISHDLGVVAQVCEEVLVMYAGQTMEHGSARDVFHHTRHPYTAALLRAIPALSGTRALRLAAIAGQPPSLVDVPSGCPFHPRCTLAFDLCDRERPALRPGAGHRKACHLTRLP